MTENKNEKTRLRVYRKKSTFKGATEGDFWYSATRSDGCSVICKFKCEVPENIGSAFEIYNIVGNMKRKEVNVKGEVYINYTYYINECEFSEIEGEPLPIWQNKVRPIAGKLLPAMGIFL